MGSGARVFFTETKSSFLSVSEARVTGKGYVAANNWDANEFTYSVKVKRSNYETRDITVRFDNGQELKDDDAWSRPPGGEEYVGYFTKPSRFTNFPTSRVTFEGVAHVAAIDLRIYDRKGNQVEQRRVSAKNGKWSATETLQPGVYRAVLGLGRMADSDEVRFSVKSNSDDWVITPGWGVRGVDITHPKSGSTVLTPMTQISGTSSAHYVTLIVTKSSGADVTRRKVPVSRDKWSASLKLAPGSYRAVATNVGGQGMDQVTFTCGSTNEARVTITHPKNGSTLNTLHADLQGTSTESDISLMVYDSSGKVVSNQSLAVNNGRWTTSLRLARGRYRVKATAGSTKDTDEIWFNYGTEGPSEGRLSITYPTSNSTVSSMSVAIQGTCRDSGVTVKVYDSRNRLVANHGIRVQNGRWSTEVRLGNGKYLVRATSGNGKGTDEIRFTRTNAP